MSVSIEKGYEAVTYKVADVEKIGGARSNESTERAESGKQRSLVASAGGADAEG